MSIPNIAKRPVKKQMFGNLGKKSKRLQNPNAFNAMAP